MDNFNQALNALINGEVIAYPTEGVFGLGCDPDNGEAINKLLQLKQRPAEKGLILIAANYQQLAKYIDESQLTAEQLQRVKESWPAAITWIMPRGAAASDLVCGEHQSIAVRVTDHPLVQKICNAFGKPLTSTSANLSGLPSCLTTEEVRSQFGSQQLVVLEGKTGGRTAPSEIRDAKTLQVLRQG